MTMLDAGIWEPTPLGIVGPRGLLDAYYAGHHNYVYHGFPSTYLEPYDLLAELVCTDDEHLLALLNDKIRAIPGVTETETFVYLKLAKQTYAWGTR